MESSHVSSIAVNKGSPDYSHLLSVTAPSCSRDLTRKPPQSPARVQPKRGPPAPGRARVLPQSPVSTGSLPPRHPAAPPGAQPRGARERGSRAWWGPCSKPSPPRRTCKTISIRIPFPSPTDPGHELPACGEEPCCRWPAPPDPPWPHASPSAPGVRAGDSALERGQQRGARATRWPQQLTRPAAARHMRAAGLAGREGARPVIPSRWPCPR